MGVCVCGVSRVFARTIASVCVGGVGEMVRLLSDADGDGGDGGDGFDDCVYLWMIPLRVDEMLVRWV